MPAGARKTPSVDTGGRLDQTEVDKQRVALFTKFLEQVNSGVSATGEDGKIVLWNNRMGVLTGLQADQAVGEYIWNVHFRLLPANSRTEQNLARIQAFFASVLKTGQVEIPAHLSELDYLRPDGQKFSLRGALYAVGTSHGYSLFVVADDVSEQKRVTGALKASEEKFRNMVEQANDAITIFDAEEKILEWNEGCERLSGLKRADVIGKRLSEVVPAVFAGGSTYESAEGVVPHELAIHYLREILQAGVPRSVDAQIVHREDGKKRWIQAVTFVVQTGSSKLFGSIARDMTSARQSEERLQRYTRQLESLRLAGLEIAAELGLDSLVWMIAPRAIEMLNGAAMALYLHEPEKDLLELAISLGENQPILEKSVRRGETLAGRVWETGKAILLEDYHTGRTANLDKKFWGKVAGAPIVWGSEFLGVLFVFSDQAFYETDLKILELFTAHAAAAIRNARLHQQLSLLAITDSLTGIFNRRHFFELAEPEYQEAVRYDRPFSVLMFDLDLFKNVNDKYGHSRGDEILRMVAQRCAATVRQTDILARYGGEEFVAVLPQTGAKKAAALADRLRQVISSSPMATEDGLLTATASFGVSTLSAGVKDLMELLNRADAALYQAKQAGRNRVCTWSDALDGFPSENWP